MMIDSKCIGNVYFSMVFFSIRAMLMNIVLKQEGDGYSGLHILCCFSQDSKPFIATEMDFMTYTPRFPQGRCYIQRVKSMAIPGKNHVT